MKDLSKVARSVSVSAYKDSNKDIVKAYKKVIAGKDSLQIAKDMICLEMAACFEVGSLEIGGIYLFIDSCAADLGFTGIDKKELIGLVVVEL